MNPVRRRVSSSCPSLAASIVNRSFSSTPSLGVSFFRRKKETPSEDPSTKEELQSEVSRSGFLSHQEKAALVSAVDKALGKTVLPYNPPEDLTDRFGEIFTKIFGPMQIKKALQVKLEDRLKKFQLLDGCEKAFNHEVPNSHLYEMKTVGDVFEFYQKSVVGVNGLTQFQRIPDLPPNLHISYNPIRFHPDNDPYYGGISAFPGRHNIVTGLKAKKVYKGFRAQTDWPKILDTYKIYRNHYDRPFYWDNDKKF